MAEPEEATWGEFRDSMLGLMIVTPFQAYVFCDFWAWFIVPLGMPALGLWHAFGVKLTLKFACGSWKTSKDPAIKVFIRAVLFTLLVWGMGSLGYIWM